MKLPLLLGVLTAAAPQPPPAPVQDVEAVRIEGVVRSVDDGARVPLPYALVEVSVAEGRRSVMADRNGAYRIEGLPPGPRHVRAFHVGYEPLELEVLVPASGTVEVDFILGRRAVRLPSIRVVADASSTIDVGPGEAPTPAKGREMVGLRALEASPGLVESGLGDAVRSVPGNEPREPSDVLLMRGSTADLKLVLLDGVPVYTPFHTGGLLQSFQMSTLGAATHHMGGAPARYDGGLSYILDLRTRAARRDRLRASGSVDLLSVKGAVETGLGGGGGLLAAGRALHEGGARLAGGTRSPYGYRDLLVRGDVDTGERGNLSFMGFTNHEAVHLDMPASETRPGLDEASWGNRALSTRWTSPLGEGAHLDLGVAAMSYRAELPVLPASPPAEGEDSEVYVASGRTERTRVTADLRLPGVAGGLRIGAALDRTDAAYGTRSAGDVTSAVRSQGSVLGAYVDGLYDLGDELDVRYGLRVDRFDPGGVGAALRLAALWSLGSDVLVTVAGGRYHQLVRLGDTEIDLGLGDGLLAGTVPDPESGRNHLSALLRPALADHLTLSLDQFVTSRVRLTFEGYLKRFSNVGTGESPGLTNSGADLRVIRESETTTAWLGYSLAWFWERGAEPRDFSGRHLLSAGLQAPVLGPVGLDLRASFSEGLPLTAVVLDQTQGRTLTTADAGVQLTSGAQEASSTTTTTTDGFLRLDAEIYAEWTREQGSRTWYIRPYLRILNALDRRDALFYYFEPWRSDELRPLAELSLVPVAGIEWRF